MPLYQHKARGFCLAEDAYVRRCAQGEFTRDEFVEVVEVAAPVATEVAEVVAPAAPAAVETVPVIEFTEEPQTGPPSADDDGIDHESAARSEQYAHHTKPAPRKSRR